MDKIKVLKKAFIEHCEAEKAYHEKVKELFPAGTKIVHYKFRNPKCCAVIRSWNGRVFVESIETGKRYWIGVWWIFTHKECK